MSETPSYDYESKEELLKEPWDYEVFVAEYNRAAGTNFHHYIEDSATEHLKKNYEKFGDRYKTVKSFAIFQLECEQVYTDDVLQKYRK